MSCFVHSRRSREQVIGEDDVGTNETVVLDGNAFPNADVVLDRHVVTDASSGLEKSVVPNVTVATNLNIRQNVCEGPDPRSGPNGFAFDECRFVYEFRRHHVQLFLPTIISFRLPATDRAPEEVPRRPGFLAMRSLPLQSLARHPVRFGHRFWDVGCRQCSPRNS